MSICPKPVHPCSRGRGPFTDRIYEALDFQPAVKSMAGQRGRNPTPHSMHSISPASLPRYTRRNQTGTMARMLTEQFEAQCRWFLVVRARNPPSR